MVRHTEELFQASATNHPLHDLDFVAWCDAEKQVDKAYARLAPRTKLAGNFSKE